MDCSPPGSSVHGIHQARILEWVAISFSRGYLPNPGIEPRSPTLQADALTSEPLWCWRSLLRVPYTARSNQSILKETGPEYSLEGLMLKLRLQYFSHLMGRTDSFEKNLMLGKTEGRRRRGRQRMRWLDGTTDSMNMSLWLRG